MGCYSSVPWSFCPSNSGKKQQSDLGKERALCWEPPYSGSLCSLLSKTWSFICRTLLSLVPALFPVSSQGLPSLTPYSHFKPELPQSHKPLETFGFVYFVSLLKILGHGSRRVEKSWRLRLPTTVSRAVFPGPLPYKALSQVLRASGRLCVVALR